MQASQALQKNLPLVLSLAVVVLALAGGAYYLYSRIAAESEAITQLEQKIQEYNTLLQMDPFPNKENIEKVQKEAQRLESFVSKVVSKFKPVPAEIANAPGDFKSMLESTIYQMNQLLSSKGIQTPTNFNYSFSVQRSLLQLDTNQLDRLSIQLAHIKLLTTLLASNNVYGIYGFKRVPATTNDFNGLGNYTSDFIPDRKVETNQFGEVYQYELSFKCSTMELVKILNDLNRSPYGIVVKSISVEPAEAGEIIESIESGSSDAAYNEQMARYQMMMRYGLAGRGRGRFGPPPPGAPGQPETSQTTNKVGIVIQEHALRVTTRLNIIQLKGV